MPAPPIASLLAVLLAAQAPLEGATSERTLASEALGEERAVTVYLPPGHDPDGCYPVVYLADGASTPGYAARLEPAILAGTVPPTVLVGAHSPRSAPLATFDPARDLRSAEYLVGFAALVEGVDAQRFDRHERFFVEELATWAEAELGASPLRSERAIFGTSSGAALAVTLGRRHAGRFGHVLAFSLGWPPATEDLDGELGASPRTWLWVGEREEEFLATTRAWAARLQEAGIEHALETGDAGHDEEAWPARFADAVAWAFADAGEERR